MGAWDVNKENISGNNHNGKGTNNKNRLLCTLPLTNIVYGVKSVCYCDDNQQVDLDLV